METLLRNVKNDKIDFFVLFENKALNGIIIIFDCHPGIETVLSIPIKPIYVICHTSFMPFYGIFGINDV